jgi:hypothetical protein
MPGPGVRVFVVRSVVQSVGHTSQRPGWSPPPGAVPPVLDTRWPWCLEYLVPLLSSYRLTEKRKAHAQPERSSADHVWQHLLETFLAPRRDAPVQKSPAGACRAQAPAGVACLLPAQPLKNLFLVFSHFSARRCNSWQYAPGPLRKLLRRKNSSGAWICSSMSPQAKPTV